MSLKYRPDGTGRLVCYSSLDSVYMLHQQNSRLQIQKKCMCLFETNPNSVPQRRAFQLEEMIDKCIGEECRLIAQAPGRGRHSR